MVGDDAVGGVDAIYIVGTKAPFVRTNAGEFSDLVKNGKEDICIVIGSPVLDGGDQSFKAHAGVDVFRGKGTKRPIVFAVKLDEDIVPDLQDVRIVLVDEMTSVSATYAIIMNFTGERGDERDGLSQGGKR